MTFTFPYEFGITYHHAAIPSLCIFLPSRPYCCSSASLTTSNHIWEEYVLTKNDFLISMRFVSRACLFQPRHYILYVCSFFKPSRMIDICTSLFFWSQDHLQELAY
jgi:hypothetical protein